MIDLTGEWYSDDLQLRYEEQCLMIRNLNTMLYRFKDDEKIKEKVKAQIVIEQKKVCEIDAQNKQLIKARDLEFLDSLLMGSSRLGTDMEGYAE